MAILNVVLLDNSESVIDASNASDGDVVNLNLLGSGTLVVDGVDVTLGTLAGVGVSSPTFAAQNGGSLTIDQGLLSVNLLSSPTFEARDSGTVRLDASAISLGLTETLLNSFSVNYTGTYHTGTFIYSPPAISLLALGPQTLVVQDMASTDRLVIDGRTNLRLDAPLTGFPPERNPDDAYYDGYLHLVSPAIPLLGEQVNILIPMTSEEFADFKANQNTLLTADTFIFPGTLLVCFSRGTLILTEAGEVAIETLQVGDRVLTGDHGPQPLRWIGSRRLTAAELNRQPQLRPIRIRAGALGAGRPTRDLTVSPQHRVLVRSRIARRMFDAGEVLVPALSLLGLKGIEVVTDPAPVDYFHLLFDRHEVVFANGCETESLFTGPEAVRALGGEVLRELAAIFPALIEAGTTPPTRPTTGRRASRAASGRAAPQEPGASGRSRSGMTPRRPFAAPAASGAAIAKMHKACATMQGGWAVCRCRP